MSAKHTPGPWEILRHCNVRANDPDAVGVGSDRGVVADVWKDGVMEKAGEANANLIAAAPTMRSYIETKAADGDAEAIKILEAIDVHT
jgi:hypothetical protein